MMSSEDDQEKIEIDHDIENPVIGYDSKGIK